MVTRETLEWIFPFFALGWIVAWIVASVLYRRKLNKPLFPRIPDGADFAEARRSGRSLRNFLTRIGGARNCLLIYVNNGTLTIRPTFPFNLMFLPEVYGLEIAVPVGDVKISKASRNRVLLTADGAPQERIEISIQDVEAFRRALGGN